MCVTIATATLADTKQTRQEEELKEAIREWNPCSQKRASSPVSRTPLAGAADQFRERSSTGGVRFLP